MKCGQSGINANILNRLYSKQSDQKRMKTIAKEKPITVGSVARFSYDPVVLPDKRWFQFSENQCVILLINLQKKRLSVTIAYCNDICRSGRCKKGGGRYAKDKNNFCHYLSCQFIIYLLNDDQLGWNSRFLA